MSARPGGWRLTAVALLLLLAVPRLPAAAQDDPYTATVTIDATSDSVAKARDVARIDGARRALDAVIARLAGGPDKAKGLKLSDNQITDLVASFEVANEKMTAVRYTADYTYHFKHAEVNRALQSAGIAVNVPAGAPNAPPGSLATAGSLAGKPVVVLPIYQDGDTALLWDDPNPWREAWSARAVGTTGTLLMVPLGDVSDVAAIDADKARRGDAAALAAIAKKEGADDVLVMVALRRAGGKPGLDITVRRYHGGQFVDVHTDSVDANAGGDDAELFHRAVDTIAADIDNGWKNAKTEPSGPPASVDVVATITSLDDWIKLRDTLGSAPSVRKIEVKTLSRQEATIEIDYAGSIDQLKANLASVQLDLEGGDPVWRLARAPGQ
ncbi:MAG TPA: DUF2066 domain-containing protein [Stellaceae bacterium]|nr:DUF2066 domain-containing protein [Stellaceae bacterium]